MNYPPILDMTCGARSMWCNKKDPRILAFDCRRETYEFIDRGTIRRIEVKPDILGDYRALPFPDSTFYKVIFDPPHLYRVGETGWLFKRYGKLEKDRWKDDIRQAFAEAWRVLRPGGTLQFKFSEIQIPLAQVKELYPDQPITQTGSRRSTYVIDFFKMP